jgi:hypothetical protein
LLISFISALLPVAMQFKAWTVLACSNTGVLMYESLRRHGCLSAFILCLCCPV